MASEHEKVNAYIAEFVGTFLLVFTVGCNVLSGSPTWAVTSIAAVLMVSIYALGGVSGANFNPAVSVALLLSKKEDAKVVGIFCAVQILAGIAAGCCYGLMFMKVVNVGPQPGHNMFEAAGAELLYTFVLCFVVLNVAASKKNGCATGNQFYGLAIGFVIIAGGYGAGSISGGCFNPAVALGLDITSAALGFGYSILYVVAEFAGAALAFVMFKICRPEDFDDNITNVSQIKPYELKEKCVSEFLGTYVLVLTVGLNVLGMSPAGAWSIAAALMCMIFALGNCSGAHFNPAVTVAIMLSGRDKCDPKEGGAFIGAQITGGLFAAATYMSLNKFASIPLGPKIGYNLAQACAGELVFTFVLCFVVLSVATVKEPLSQYFGLAIGSCVTAGGLAIGNVSGGSLNPAVSSSLALSHFIRKFNFVTLLNLLAYWGAEFAGAGLAAVVFKATHTDQYAKGVLIPFARASPMME